MTAPPPQSDFTPEALAALRAHPRFDEAVLHLARGSLQEFAAADETGRWMFRDLGRSSLYLAAVILDSTETGLTASILAKLARANDTASRGRVMAFLRRAEAAGEVVVPAGKGPWTRRRLTLQPAFIDRFRKGNRIYADALARLSPEVAPLAARLDEAVFFRSFALWVGVASQRAGTPVGRSERLFLERDRGMSILFRLMVSQSGPGERLLHSAPLSRSRLSREFGVSRIHINRLLADAAAAGLLSCPSPERLVFSAAFSEAVEQMLALTLQITRAALLGAQAMTAGADGNAAVSPNVIATID